ncbi:alginate lyase family protein [Piscinibacter terrae]|nr:alginate lyase family protein [Albitalea terrae]
MTAAPEPVLEVPTAQTLVAAKVKDPNASFFDVAARRRQLAGDLPPRVRASLPPRTGCSTTAAPTPPTGAMEIPRRYLAPPPGRGPLNPEQAKRAGPYWQLEDFVAEASTRYGAYGDPAVASCLLATLDAWARAETLLNYDPKAWSQSWFTVEWTTTSAALAVSIIRAEPSLDQDSLQRVTAWLDRVARKQLSHTAVMGGSQNNHAYWRGLMATSTAIVAADDELFRQGLALFATGIEHIAEDGSFPLEMQRGELAVHYQNFAIMPLMATAELARRQGIDLYRYSANGRTLQNAAGFLLSALDDPAVVRKHQSMAQDEVPPEDLSWMEWAALRWHDPRLARHLTHPMFHRRLGGGITALVAGTTPSH